MMTIKDLIEELQKYPENTKVGLGFHYGGYYDLSKVEKIKIVRDWNKNTLLSREHEDLDSIFINSGECICEELCICSKYEVTETTIKRMSGNPNLLSLYEEDLGKVYTIEEFIVLD